MKNIHCTYLSVLLTAAFACKKVNNDCKINDFPDAPNLTWKIEVNGSENESHGHFILSTSDGGFLQVGETGFLPNSAKILVVKTDQNGNLLWKKEFGTAGNNLGNSAVEVADGYVVAGALNENSALIKLDKSDGSILFQEIHDNGGNDAYEHLTVNESGIVAVGYINASDHTNTFYTEGEGYVSFLNVNGIKNSELKLEQHLSQGYRIANVNDEYIISGLTEGAKEFGLVKIDSTGAVLWSKNYGGNSADHCFGMDVSSNGDIFLTGHTLSGTENWDTYTMKIDLSGNQIWEAKVGNPRGFKPKYIHDEAWDVKHTSDGGCIIVAGTGDEYGRYKRKCGNDGDNSNTWHIYLIKFDGNGNVEWQKTYGGGENMDWAGEAIDLTSDGGAIVALDNGQFGFVKIEPF